MSLLATASVWTNDDNSSKKRVSTMRKTVKKMPSSSLNSVGEPAEYSSYDQEYRDSTVQNEPKPGTSQISLEENAENPDSLQNTIKSQETRTNRVNELLHKITSVNSENAGNGLSSFNPIDNPNINSRKNDILDTNSLTAPDESLYIQPPAFNTTDHSAIKSSYGSQNSQGLGNYGNYKQSYEPPKQLAARNNSYYGSMGLGNSNTGATDNKIMDKINYMIHMMEEQHNEKTGNVLEEIVLYSFLGIFIIFVVDSFARSGKRYTR